LGVLVAVVIGSYLALRGLGVFGAPGGAQAQSVPRGDQEVAWINPATGGTGWQRFVTAVRRVRDDWPGLQLEDANAFPEQTTAVPEIALSLDGCPGKLWVRWYKLTSDTGVEQWVEALARREPSPLAIIGGGSSDRARDLAKALATQQGWHGASPLLLITTATADKVRLDEQQHPVLTPHMVDQSKEPWQDLMGVYPGRTFRFCFTNRQMAEAVVDFVWSRPYLRPHGSDPHAALGAVAQAGANPWGALAWLTVGPPPSVCALARWLDDPYSIDLAERFREVLDRPAWKPRQTFLYELPYSVGDFGDPNPQESLAARSLLTDLGSLEGQRALLVIPAMDKPARRFLRALSLSAPLDVRQLVAVTGDSISFNTLCRDRDFAWNVQEMPLPLVVFCHQNPVAWDTESATDDVLLNVDIVRVLLQTAFHSSHNRQTPRLLSNADRLAERFQTQHPPFFEANGDRRAGRGEHLACLRPVIEQGRVLPSAVIEVWRREPSPAGSRWEPVRRIVREPDAVIP
jgi:hypothetical protein